MKEVQTIQTQMRRGVLEFCILLIINKEPVYVSDILKELQKADLLVVEGTVYPLLTRLKDEGLLAYDWQESKSGPPRKYYSLTRAGTQYLEKLTAMWSNLTDSITSLIKK